MVIFHSVQELFFCTSFMKNEKQANDSSNMVGATSNPAGKQASSLPLASSGQTGVGSRLLYMYMYMGGWFGRRC